MASTITTTRARTGLLTGLSTRLLTGLAALAALTACTGTAEEPDTGPPPTTTAPASPTTSPTPPAMPAAARAHTRAGAEAFVRYFWRVVGFAQVTGDTSRIRSISVPGCAGCEGGIRAVDRVYQAGGKLAASSPRLGALSVTMVRDAAGHEIAEVHVTVTFSKEVLDYPGTSKDVTHASSTSRYELQLLRQGQTWRTAQLAVSR